MVLTLLTGATGRLGDVLGPRLEAAGHDVRAASRTPPGPACDRWDPEWVELDLATGEGVEPAVEGVEVLIHCASAPTGNTEAVDVEGTERLLAVAEGAGVEQVVYPSVVGVEAIPYSYYDHKLAAEKAIEASEVGATIVRATQFHGFVDELLGTVAKLPVWPLPTGFRVQPVDEREFADVLVEYATAGPGGRASPVCGPEVHTLGELARAYREARDLHRAVLRVPVPGGVASGFRAGHATCDGAAGAVTWREYLDERYGRPGPGAGESAKSPS